MAESLEQRKELNSYNMMQSEDFAATQRHAKRQPAVLSAHTSDIYRRWLIGSLVGFAALVTLMTGAAEAFIRLVVDRQIMFDQHVALYFDSKKKGVSNVVFGDSSTEVGFLSDRADFVNLSLGAEVLPLTIVRIKKYFEDIDPGFVVLYANHQTLAREDDRFNNHDFEGLFSGTERWPLRILEQHHRNLLFDHLRKYILHGRLQWRWGLLPRGGVIWLTPDQERVDRRLQHGPEKALLELPTPERRRDNQGLYLGLLEYLKSKGAKVCLVTYPTASTFRAEADKHPEFQGVRDWYAEVAQRYGFKYANYWDVFDDLSAFIDSTHLAESTARQLTPMILRDCFGL